MAAARLRVLIPGLVRSYTAGAAVVDVDLPAAAATLGDALGALDARFPGLRFRLVDEQGGIRRHIRCFVDGAEARSLADPVAAGSELMIVGALSGG
jgi:molybdopterin synthase sulfur carrier subunit